MVRGLFSRGSRREPAAPPVPIAQLRRRFTDMDRDELYRVRRMWTARYLPVWYAVYDTVAEAGSWTEARRSKHRDAMDGALELADTWWDGGRRIETRRRAVESAVSAITHFAPQLCPHEPWVPHARQAALQVRYLLQFVYDRDSDFCVRQSASMPYLWGELETWWPADSAALLGSLPGEMLREVGEESTVHIYATAAPAAGLRSQGQAVIDAVHRIVDHLGEDPGPFPTDDLLTSGPGDTLRRAQRAASYEAFHGRQPPGFVR